MESFQSKLDMQLPANDVEGKGQSHIVDSRSRDVNAAKWSIQLPDHLLENCRHDSDSAPENFTPRLRGRLSARRFDNTIKLHQAHFLRDAANILDHCQGTPIRRRVEYRATARRCWTAPLTLTNGFSFVTDPTCRNRRRLRPVGGRPLLHRLLHLRHCHHLQ
jgi:hypothetical protein